MWLGLPSRLSRGFGCQSSGDSPSETCRRWEIPRKRCWSADPSGLGQLQRRLELRSPALGLLHEYFPDTFPCLSAWVDVEVCSKHASYTGSAPASHCKMGLCFLSPALT